MFTYLKFCGVYSLLFSFFRYWVSITCWSKDTCLISDTTRINYFSFSCGQVFSLGICLMMPPYLGVWVHSKEKLFSFLSGFSAQHYFGIWVFSISQIMFLVFQWTKATPMRLHPLRNKRKHIMCPHPLWLPGNSLCVFTRWWINGNYLVSVVWKFTTCWFFFFCNFFLKLWSQVCLSADIYIANKEWGSPMPILPCNNREDERDSLSQFHYSVILTTIVRWFMLATIVGCRPPSL